MMKNEFLNKIKELAKKNMMETGILASLTIAQAALESGWGNSGLTVKGNALFGIKAGNNWAGKVYVGTTQECYDGINFVTVQGATFRAYESWEDSITDHSVLFNKAARYANLRGLKDYRLACKYVKEDGYATDPDYTSKLLNIIETYSLYKCDTEVIEDMKKIEDLEKRVSALELKQEKTYNKVDEMPDWSKDKIQNLVDNGYLKGDENGNLGLTLTMIRLLTSDVRMHE